MIIDKGILPTVESLMLRTQNVELKAQIIWLLGNIAIDNTKYRDYINRSKKLLSKMIETYYIYQNDQKKRK